MISGSWPGELYLFRRKPNGIFTAAEKLKDARGKLINAGKASAVAVADWDNDADLDLIIGNIDGAVLLVRNEGTKQKPGFGDMEKLKAGPASINAEGGDAGPCVADWDADGKLDLLVGSASGEVKLYRNEGTGTPKLAAGVTLVDAAPKRSDDGRTPEYDKPTRPGLRSKVCVADWNGDGRADLLVGDFHSAGGETRQYHGWVWVYLRRAAAQASR